MDLVFSLFESSEKTIINDICFASIIAYYEVKFYGYTEK